MAAVALSDHDEECETLSASLLGDSAAAPRLNGAALVGGGARPSDQAIVKADAWRPFTVDRPHSPRHDLPGRPPDRQFQCIEEA